MPVTQQGAPNLLGTISGGTAAFPVTQPLFFGRIGPYFYGDNSYIITCEAPDDTSHPNIVVYKSTDGWHTNTRLVAGPTLTFGEDACVYFPYTGSVIYVAYMDDSGGNKGDLNVITFDMATENLSSPDPIGVSITTSLTTIYIVSRPDGTLVVAWDQFIGSRKVRASVKSSGVWGSPIDVTGVVTGSTRPAGMIVDANGNAGLWWFKGSAFSSATNSYYSIISTTLVSTTTMAVDPTNTQWSDFGWPGLYDAATDSVAWAITRKANSADSEIVLLVGTTISTSASFSLVSVFHEASTLDEFQVAQTIAITEGFCSLWVTVLGDNTQIIQYSTATSFTGPWTTPALFYSQPDSPPVPPPVSDELFPLWTVTLPDGSPGGVVGMLIDVVTVAFCGVLFTWPITPPEPGCPTIYVARQPQPDAPAPPPPPGIPR